ncbi:lactate dehydrogenase [Clostridium botulinum]|uniref:D-isomer specific 2-hydroxyacid dehydrogenase family protein n=1 Tax=Clostridium TaxID=1485 RepID=UPI001A921051|nr:MULTISPECIES: D-isomer specific 2-hydroxyacid dehydrogenase family protein [Clostridium]MBO0525733.1 lactate dehydrogenase [Clostridium botulinum]MBO0528658.1 lactate dehydrogenase [Clostridium botulinum]MBO0532334.1 lactate dehydrogenase [Clostridium botulinum]MBO0536454.1 lactate dehydrogenase [Clostridium botulinum]MBO0539244.1 lactate dehydrogenase [Clostridium botulinum]
MKILAYCVRPDEIDSFKNFSEKYGHTVDLIPDSFGPSVAHLAKGYDGISILGNDTCNREALEKIKDCGIKYLATRTAGVNNIDFDAAKEFGINVANVPAYSPNSVSEFTVGLALSLTRKIPFALKRVELNNFALGGLIGVELRNLTLGVIGTGRIGLKVIEGFSGFGMKKMIGYDIFENEKAKKYIEYKSLDEVYKEADIITLHAPLTDDNYHMIGKESIAKMKDGVFIINAARGALIDSEALIEGLKSGKIAGAALDSYEYEQGVFHNNKMNEIMKDDTLARLKSFPNVVITPHLGFYTDEAVSNMVEITLMNLQEFELKGTCKNQRVCK